MAIPPTVILPHQKHPEGTTDQSMRNLIYPLDWDDIFHYVGFPAFLKPYSGGGWKHVYKVHSPEEFFHHYNQTGDLCMTLQRAVNFQEYFRCYVVGQEKVHIMQYDPRRPHHRSRNGRNARTLRADNRSAWSDGDPWPHRFPRPLHSLWPESRA